MTLSDGKMKGSANMNGLTIAVARVVLLSLIFGVIVTV